MRNSSAWLGATTAVVVLSTFAIVPIACQPGSEAACQTICDCLGDEGGGDACVESCESDITDVDVCLDEFADTGCQQHCGAFGIGEGSGNGGGNFNPNFGHSSTPQGQGCIDECDFCWVDTKAEDHCPDWWEGTDDGCDCGCQFDDPDCIGAEGEAEAEAEGEGECDYCWTPPCPESWQTDADCDCGCQFDDEGCPGTDPEPDCPASMCPDYCTNCYLGTTTENNCDLEWNGDGKSCDCGCQFVDIDCVPEGEG